MGFVGNLVKGLTGAAGMNGANPVDDASVRDSLSKQRDAFDAQRNFALQLGQQPGIQNQNDVFAQQQALANQFGQNALGLGPNPAQAALAQNTQANIANQAALMAGQRGASANAGLIARQAAMQGGNIQQQSVGQAATMQAQQQLAAQQQQAAQQQAMQGVAQSQIGNAAGALSGTTGAAQNLYNTQLGNNTQNQVAMNQASGQMGSAIVGGLLGGASAALTGGLSGGGGASALNIPSSGFMMSGQPNSMSSTGMYTAYNGGMVPSYNQGGSVGGPSSSVGKFFSGQRMNQGGTVNMVDGGQVTGQANVAGDSPKNDTVPAMLSPQEIVIPREIVLHPNAPQLAAQFVAQEIAKHRGNGK